ncbi:MAG: GNAT family N-acetyltransferase [Candidatus Pacearchaeota archaeon]|nr:GNAT family N-acetyltransferase [Candidatus Pacearchaeota archaeon]
MDIDIRKPRLEPKINGIPKDFYDVMGYFNKAIAENKYPFIPRKNPITPNEITKLWIPSLDKNLCFLVESDGKIIGSATCLFDVNSNEYEQAKDRVPGEIALTIDPSHNHKLIGKMLISRMAKELLTKHKTGIFHTDVNWTDELKMMAELEINGKLLENYERYKKAGLSGKVLEYSLP